MVLVGDGYVIAPLGKSLLYYQQTTGSLVRSAGLFESAVGPAVIANYVVFVPEQNNVEAFDVYGDLLWRGQAPSVTGLAIANGQLDVSTSAGIVAFDLAGATK